MFKIKIAEFVIEVHNRFDFIENQCKDYIYVGDACDMIAECTLEQIENEKKILNDPIYTDGYIESVCLYRSICLQLPKQDSFVMHAAVVGVDGKAYAFTAKSGTGKSTHIRQWKKHLGDRVYVVNGDKPILRFVDGKLMVYGTPWCGKEGWHQNTSAELVGLCFLERVENNSIVPITPSEAATPLMKQILIPKDAEGAIKTFELVDKMLKCTKLWRLGCNISVEAGKIAYEAMSGVKNEN